MIFSPALIQAEHIIAQNLTLLNKVPCDKFDSKVDGLLYNQHEAVEQACTNRVSVLTGPAGTGKTTTLRRIVDSLLSAGCNGFCASPTGKASKRAYESINTLENGKNRETPIRCGTIHKIIGYDFNTGRCKYNPDNQFQADFIIIDEFSMCGVVNFADLLQAINPEKTRIILCGDTNQLPSVSAGNISRDILDCDFFKITKLEKIIRQDENSGIVHNATNVLNGRNIEHTICKENDNVTFKDFFFIETKDDEETKKKVLSFITEALPERRKYTCDKPGSMDVQFLCPGKRGVVGTYELNKEISNTINPSKKIKHGFKVGDKVINKKNDYENMIVNGDVGIVKELGDRGIEIDFGDNCGPNQDGKVIIQGAKLDQIQLANAYTIHSSQGSEYKCVIYPFSTAHWILHSRNLMYTGMTRAKELDILIGSNKCKNQAIRNVKPVKRNTALKQLLYIEHKKTKI